jgi:hypothetical protein
MNGFILALLLALVAAVLLTAAGWLWGRTRSWQRLSRAWTWLWAILHKRQIEEIDELRNEINELRKDVDALLSVLDHWVTPGAGDMQRQFGYMAEVLEARNKRGVSEAYMRVASIIDDQRY